MRKKVTSIFMITCLLAVGITTPIQAAESTKDVIVSYESNRALSIQGKKEVIKGTANHSYKGFFEDIEADVIWSIEGATSKNTRIDEGGFLIVGVDETSDKIQVSATSKNNPDNQATLEVILIEKTYTTVSVEKKDDITMNYGTTENELVNRLGEYKTFQVTIKTNDEKVYVIDVNQASFHSKDDVVDANGIVKEGSFDVIYNLILPHLQIEYDGTITTKTSEKTNIIGKASSSIKVTIVNRGEPVKPSVPVNPIKGPNTGDTTNPIMNIMVGGVALLSLLLLWKRRKEEKN